MAGLLRKVYSLYSLYSLKQSPTLEKGYTRMDMVKEALARERSNNSEYSEYKLLKPYNHRHLRAYSLLKRVSTSVSAVSTC